MGPHQPSKGVAFSHLSSIRPSIHRVFSTFSELGTALIKKTEICFQISHLIHCRKSPEGGSVRGAP